MINKKIKLLRKKFVALKLDGYVVPKNDEFFGEYPEHDRLKIISGFDGSAGLAIILKNKNYLFVDGRYTIQAKKQSGKYFNIIEIHKFLPFKKIRKLKLGFDPQLFTTRQLNIYFNNKLTLEPISKNLIDVIYKKRKTKSKLFFSLDERVTGENHKSKIKKIVKELKYYKSDYMFISAPENVAWLLNIRGYDSPYSPIPNCRVIVANDKKIFLVVNKNKISNIIKKKIIEI